VREYQDCSDWSADAEDPTADNEVRLNWHGPENCREEEQHKQSGPLKGATRPGSYMRLLTAYRAQPAFPKSEWQERDPKDVQRVEAPHLHRPKCLPARQAMVIAKCNAFTPEVVDAMDDDHSVPARGGRSWQRHRPE
jgi:hypothetical protein